MKTALNIARKMAAISCQYTIEVFSKLSSIEHDNDKSSSYQISGTMESDNEVSSANANFDYDCGSDFPHIEYSGLQILTRLTGME